MELLLNQASSWVRRWSHLVHPGASVLDVACGSGRHVRWFAQRGCHVTGVDRDIDAVRPLRHLADIVVADIEKEPWPFAGRRFDAVVVTNYLWRPLLPAIVECAGKVLLYETFSLGQQALGRPSNPEFLLYPGELIDAARSLRIVAYEDGFLDGPPRLVQRVAAIRSTDQPARPALESPG